MMKCHRTKNSLISKKILEEKQLSNSSQVSFQDMGLIDRTICSLSWTLLLPYLERDQTWIYHHCVLPAFENNQVSVLPSFPTAKNTLQNFALALLMSWRGKCHYPCFTDEVTSLSNLPKVTQLDFFLSLHRRGLIWRLWRACWSPLLSLGNCGWAVTQAMKNHC